MKEYLLKNNLIQDIIARGIRVLIIGFIFLVTIRLIRSAEKIILKLARHRNLDDSGSFHPEKIDERDRRLATVLRVFGTALRVGLLLLGFIMILKELGFDVTPLLTGAGVAGVAIGFGAQTLVKDVISGIFLLLEDQIRIGDSVRVGGLSGVVERMELRCTALRDVDGTLHIVPNGEIKTVSNMSYLCGCAVIDVPISYEIPVIKAIEVIRGACSTFQAEVAWKERTFEAISVQAITEFTSTDLKVRVLVRTPTQDRGAVQLELRLRIKAAFENAGLLMGASAYPFGPKEIL